MENKEKEIISLIFSVKMPIDRTIRRKANLIEDFFNEKYLPPVIIPVPDDLDPAVPRVQIQSKNAHSSIFFTQQSIDLTINFDSKFSKELGKCFEYFNERIELILKIMQNMGKSHFYYTGTTLTYRIKLNEQKVCEFFNSNSPISKDLYDLEIKSTEVLNDKYFVNLITSNFRNYSGEIQSPENQFLLNFALATKSEEGIQKIIDVNDRYLYNTQGYTYDLAHLREEILETTKIVQERFDCDANEK